MIEQALYEHLQACPDLAALLTTYNGLPAVFNQEAPSDTDPLWAPGAQYSRLVFAVDIQGDPERTMGGTLTVDVFCKDDEAYPEDLEPVVRAAIDGYFFSNGTFTVAAQWKNSSYFTAPTERVTGCTLAFALLGFPVITTDVPDIVERFNAWSADVEGLHVINHDQLPTRAWVPDASASAIYWRVVQDKECSWIPSTFQQEMRTALVRCHIFSQNRATAAKVARNLAVRLHSLKRLMKDGETPIMVNRDNTIENGADPLRTGQLTVDATYAVITHFDIQEPIKDITVSDGGTMPDGQ